MNMTSSIVVTRGLEEVWAFLANTDNAPRWDRSIASAQLVSGPMEVGAVVQTTAPSGMQQSFRVDELSPLRRLRFSVLRSSLFQSADLIFTLEPAGSGTRITHDIVVAFRFPWWLLRPVFHLMQRRALGTDLEFLRRSLDEGLDLTRAPT